MAWDFSTDPQWAAQLAWVDQFVRAECEPIDLIVRESHDLNDPVRQALIPPLQQIVKERGLWATHLGPHLGGPGHGQVKLALLNEILGRSECAPIVFGSQAPDSGNSEILAHYGTPELKQRYLEPLLDNRIVSCFSMTEPQGGADPKVFTTAAVQDGDEWVINGEKWFSSFASMASFLIVMAVTDPDAPPYQRHSMFVVPAETPGINVLRDVGLGYRLPETGAVVVEKRLLRGVQISADSEQLFRVVLNLLSNARQALDTAKTPGQKRILIEAGRTNGMITIDISDNGPGIPVAVRDRLFQPFAGTMRQGGSGLGLAISRELIAAHGGTLVLVSTGSEGTRFRITLPAQG